jgi:hypothetical protein
MDNLIYLTYQSFPSQKANTIQTIDNINYLSKYFEIELIFPLREKNSTDDIQVLKNHYSKIPNIKISGKVHNLPFGKIKIFEKYFFTISHYLWARAETKKITLRDNQYFFTRSDWVFYFLSRSGVKVVFECHQLSKTRKWVMKKAIKNTGSKVIFLNKQLLADSGLDNIRFQNKTSVIHNGVDSLLFSFKKTTNNKEVLFAGALKRFNEDRNIKFLIKCFQDKQLKDYKLIVLGGTKKEVVELNAYIEKLKIVNVKLHGQVSRKELVNYMKNSEIGLLINSGNNDHSLKYTSPLKYFEYLYSGLKIVAIDFPSHRILPFAEKINFFKENDSIGFIESIKKASFEDCIKSNQLQDITLVERAKKIHLFITE